MSEEKPAVSWNVETQDKAVPCVTFGHWFFHKMEDIFFTKPEQSNEPVMMVKYAKNDVAMTFKGVMREFNIEENSADGAMLEKVAKGLNYVKGLRIGDPLPKEILTREASWALSDRHLKIAYQRLSLQLVNWMTGGQSVITDPDELLQLAEDPQIKKSVNAAFGEAAEKLGLGRDRKEEVIMHVSELAKELAYIEALRDNFRRIRVMEQKIQTIRRLYGREKSVLEVADQVARLGERAVSEFENLFLEVDAQTGEILSVLRNLASQIPYIRDKRDELYVRLMAWDDILGEWERAQMKVHPDNPNLLRRTYHFLAPRFMMVKEWVLMTKLKQNDLSQAFSHLGGGSGMQKQGQVMRW
jgi:hypothetical protein